MHQAKMVLELLIVSLGLLVAHLAQKNLAWRMSDKIIVCLHNRSQIHCAQEVAAVGKIRGPAVKQT